MRCITLHQPWASLVAAGVKTIETRSWPTKHRGQLLIHAAQSHKTWDQLDAPSLMSERQTIQAVLGAFGVIEPDGRSWPSPWIDEDAIYLGWDVKLPLGAVVAVAQLVDCVPITNAWPENDGRHVLLGGDQRLWLYRGHPYNEWPRPEDVTDQLPFGDYRPGRWAWLLEDIRALPAPVPARGRQGLWTPSYEEFARIGDQIEAVTRG